MSIIPTITIAKISDFVDKTVRLQGWIYNKRSSGKIAFLQFRDGSGVIQAVVVKSQVSETVFELSKTISLESSVILEGIVHQDPRSPSGYELELKDLTLIQLAPDDFPIGKKEHGPDFLLSNRHLWLRSHRQWALQKIRATITDALTVFYKTEGFIKIDTPVITPNACEGTTTLFDIDYFGEKAYLSQSGQLYLEAAITSFGRVYDFQPVFRAERSKTRRHLIEFWMTNAEVAFCDLQGIMEIEERMVMAVLNRVLTECRELFPVIERDIKPLEAIKAPFPRLTFVDAVKQLNQLGSDISVDQDFGNDDETLLMQQYHTPIFVTNYDADVKAFYMKKDPKDPRTVLCNDMLAPEGYGEIIGGSEREDDYEILLASMKKHNLPIEPYQWYLDLRKYGSVPHSGFGLGLERIVAWICGLKHVRETIPFPRLLHRCNP